MAEPPDRWSSNWPESPPKPASPAVTPLRPIGGRAARFGVAHELDEAERRGGYWEGGPQPRRPVRPVPSATPEHGIWARVRTWWACRDWHPSDAWHRGQCRFGRHRVEGGRQIQLGSRFVNTERCCVWCGYKPG